MGRRPFNGKGRADAISWWQKLNREDRLDNAVGQGVPDPTADYEHLTPEARSAVARAYEQVREQAVDAEGLKGVPVSFSVPDPRIQSVVQRVSIRGPRGAHVHEHASTIPLHEAAKRAAWLLKEDEAEVAKSIQQGLPVTAGSAFEGTDFLVSVTWKLLKSI